MKKCTVALILFVFLSGCSRVPDEMEKGIALRSKLLQASACTFAAEITADYGDKVYTFFMECKVDAKGNLAFTVLKPETISGITGIVTENGGQLTFDNTALHFELLTDKEISPVTAPWILVKTLRSGYMSSACSEDGFIRLSADDSYADNPLRLDIWLNMDSIPEKADIIYDGRKILSVCVTNFEIL